MKIKRYMAASMRAALDQVRLEQGPDAVILSSRRINDGVEVIAAVDYDEALIAGAARQYALAASVAAAPAAAAPATAGAKKPRAAEPNAPAPNAPAATSADPAAKSAAPVAGTVQPPVLPAPSAVPRAPSALARDLVAVAVPQDAQRG